MFTVRNLGGLALFLFGTTFLWLTPMFATAGTSTKGFAWSIARVLSLLTIIGFSIATWGLFAKAAWWEPMAIAFAVVGLVVLVPYWIAAHNAGDPGATVNVFVHVLGSAGVMILLMVPTLERWVNGHVITGK